VLFRALVWYTTCFWKAASAYGGASGDEANHAPVGNGGRIELDGKVRLNVTNRIDWSPYSAV
jgi:hypothetical protein